MGALFAQLEHILSSSRAGGNEVSAYRGGGVSAFAGLELPAGLDRTGLVLV